MFERQKDVGLAYSLYLPSNAAGASLPMVVMLQPHDRGRESYAHATCMTQLAGKQGFAILFPQLPPPVCRTKPQWKGIAQWRGAAYATSLGAALSSAAVRRSIDASRVYIAGLSSDAPMLRTFAERHPGLIAAMGMHSATAIAAPGSAIAALAALQQLAAGGPALPTGDVPDLATGYSTPTIVIHSAPDGTVRPLNFAQTSAQVKSLSGVKNSGGQRAFPTRVTILEAIGEQRSYAQRDYYAGNRALFRVCAGCPLADGAGSAATTLGTSEGTDANALMWEFFKSQRRSPGAATATATPRSSSSRSDRIRRLSGGAQ